MVLTLAENLIKPWLVHCLWTGVPRN